MKVIFMGVVIDMADYRRRLGWNGSHVNGKVPQAHKPPLLEPVILPIRSSGAVVWIELLRHFMAIPECIAMRNDPSKALPGRLSDEFASLMAGYEVKIRKVAGIGNWHICTDFSAFLLASQNGYVTVRFPTMVVREYFFSTYKDGDSIGRVTSFTTYEALSQHARSAHIRLPEETDIYHAISTQIWRRER